MPELPAKLRLTPTPESSGHRGARVVLAVALMIAGVALFLGTGETTFLLLGLMIAGSLALLFLLEDKSALLDETGVTVRSTLSQRRLLWADAEYAFDQRDRRATRSIVIVRQTGPKARTFTIPPALIGSQAPAVLTYALARMRPAPSPPAAFELRRDIAGAVLLQRLLPLLINAPALWAVWYVWPAGGFTSHAILSHSGVKLLLLAIVNYFLFRSPFDPIVSITLDQSDLTLTSRFNTHTYPLADFTSAEVCGDSSNGMPLHRLVLHSRGSPGKVVIIPRVGPLQSFIPLCHATLCRVNTQTAVT